MLKTDHDFMSETIEQALLGKGLTSPNPMVGAILVNDGKIVGRGFHRYDLRKHAEVWAIENAKDKTNGATLYVNLEPCCHQGRTAPCCDQIIKSGIVHVVAAMKDPNPIVGGKGLEKLMEAGIKVTVGIREKEAQKLNEAYSKYIVLGQPFVTVKAGVTLDGKIAPEKGSQRWITGLESKHWAHQLRLESDSILVGIGTILQDNPRLTDRSGQERNRPLIRVILDSKLRLPLNSNLVNSVEDGDIIVFCSEDRDLDRHKKIEDRGIQIIPVAKIAQGIPLKIVLNELGRREITSLLIEGGSEVNFSALQSKIIDKLICLVAPKILGGPAGIRLFGGQGFATLEEAPLLFFSKTQKLGQDLMIEAYCLDAQSKQLQ